MSVYIALLVSALLCCTAAQARAQQPQTTGGSDLPGTAETAVVDPSAKAAVEGAGKQTEADDEGLGEPPGEGGQPDPLPREEAPPALAAIAFPAVLTSQAPDQASELVEGSADLEWLQGLVPPEFAVRWDDRLIGILDRYRSTARGRATIRALFSRAGRYEAMIRARLRKARLPEDLVYVVMIESGFDPAARSSAGAVGLWQFMKETAEGYGLEVTRWVDMRSSPEHSTDAAISYLADMHKQLGSWELALAAFNMGYGALTRSIVKYNTNDFWRLSSLEAGLPFETVYYVSRIMACAVIGHNLGRFGLADLEVDPPVETAKVRVPGGIGLHRVAAAAGIKTEELAALNPEIKRERVPPDAREWTVRIPADLRARFLQRWERLRPRTSAHRKYAVRFGERLPDVARIFNTSEKSLRLLNELPQDDLVGPGFELLVPDVEPRQAEKAEPPVIGVPDRVFVYRDRRRVFYKVASHDTLEEIGRFFQVSADEIRNWNGIASDATLSRGLFLQLFVPRGVDLSRAVVIAPDQARILVVGSDEFFDFHESQRDRVRIRYRVRPGDTVQSLANRFGLSTGSVARINRFSRYKDLEPDQEIVLYVKANETQTSK